MLTLRTTYSIGAAACLCLGGLAGAQSAEPPTRLSGHIHYLGGVWPLRANLANIDDGSAQLAFPALGVSGISTPARMNDDTVVIELPYGLGEQSLSWVDGSFQTEARPTDRESLAIVLNADIDPLPQLTDITFESRGVKLKGTMWMPGGASEEPLPLVVIGHGADRFSREMPEYVFWADHFVRRGYAAFLYDKRGVGKSQGNYDDTPLNILVDDFIAAVNAAAAHPRIDQDCIAWRGGSQFGWVAFRAARTLTPRAMVIGGAPAVDPVTLEVRVLEDQLRGQGLTGDDLADAMAYVRLYFATARHPELFDSLIAMAEHSTGTPWIDHVPIPTHPMELSWWGEHAAFDIHSDIESYSHPVFLAYGREDTIATPEINALRFERLLKKGGGQLELWIAEEADHRLEVPSTMIGESLRFPQLAPGYVERIDDFLDRYMRPANLANGT